MPYFDYVCNDCGNVQEELILNFQKEPPTCNKCGGEMWKKASATGNFRLYGEGFEKRHHKDTGDWAG